MDFPIINVPSGSTYKYWDEDSGRTWVHDNGVWTPEDFTRLDSLHDVGLNYTTVGSLKELRSIPLTQTTPVTLSTNESVALNIEVGEDCKIKDFIGYGLYKDASVTSGSVFIYIYHTDVLGLNGLTPGIIDYTTWYNLTVNPNNFAISTYLYSNSLADVPTDPTTFIPNFYNSPIYRPGKITVMIRANTSSGGSFYYDGDFKSGYTINGNGYSGASVPYSKLRYSDMDPKQSKQRWEMTNPEFPSPYNLITRSTVDPTASDLTTWQLGTYWINQTTNRVWVHSVTRSVFDGESVKAPYWLEMPVYKENRIKPAIARIHSGTADTLLNPPMQGDFFVDTSSNQLKLYNGSNWIVL